MEAKARIMQQQEDTTSAPNTSADDGMKRRPPPQRPPTLSLRESSPQDATVGTLPAPTPIAISNAAGGPSYSLASATNHTTPVTSNTPAAVDNSQYAPPTPPLLPPCMAT